MKAILLRHPGEPSALEYVEMPTPRPGVGEVLVKADTIGVSMPEVLVRRGTYAWMPPLPAIPGIELSGTVVEQGRGITKPEVGSPVFVSARDRVAVERDYGLIGMGDTSRCHPSRTTGHTGQVPGGSSRLSLGQEHEVEGDRASRSSGCAVFVWSFARAA